MTTQDPTPDASGPDRPASPRTSTSTNSPRTSYVVDPGRSESSQFDWWDEDAATDPPAGRWSTWGTVTRLSRGPEPYPDWLVIEAAATDVELGVLKSGKEAECSLIERAVPGDPTRSCVLVAKRYLDAERRNFHRAALYTEGRRTRNSRDTRALARGSAHGRAVAAGQWAQSEWQTLVQLWGLGVSVPYPVQIDGTEILMELICAGQDPAPRLVQCRGTTAELQSWYDQVVAAMELMASAGLAHGDLSPYNLLLAGDRIVLIDLPQVVDVTANPHGMELLHRDCRNVCDWFTRRGLAVAADNLLARLVGMLH